MDELWTVLAEKIAALEFSKADFYVILTIAVGVYALGLYLPHRERMTRLRLEHDREYEKAKAKYSKARRKSQQRK